MVRTFFRNNKASALLIACASYTTLAPIVGRQTVNSAEAMRKALVDGGYNPNRVKVVVDPDRAAFDRECQDFVRSDDEINLIFFFGHAIPIMARSDGKAGIYLCLPDMDKHNPDIQGIGSEQLNNIIESLPGANAAAFLDCCHAGGIGSLNNDLLVQPEKQSRLILAASPASEQTPYPKDAPLTCFSGALVEALAGTPTQPEYIRFSYLLDQVSNSESGTCPRLTLWVKVDGSNFEIARNPEFLTEYGDMSNLAPITQELIGREQEMADLETLLLKPAPRLVTLTGWGGVGKTPLALKVAHELVESYESGVCWIDLGFTQDTSHLTNIILGQFKGRITPIIGETTFETLKRSLGNRELLLVLDHFDRVLQAAPIVYDLLEACPRLKVLVTSEERLGIPAEQEYEVHPLKVPPFDDLSPEALLDYGAVQLFVNYAKLRDTSFDLTSENARDVAALCIELDGLPLAIELAANRVNSLSPKQMLDEWETYRLEFLVSGAQDDTIQNTMRSALNWSYSRLTGAQTEDVKDMFRRLSVFAQGFTREAVGEVCVGINLDLLDMLVDKSLLRSEDQLGEVKRFSMLATIREYAFKLLQASGDAEAVQHLHAEYYFTMAKKTKDQLGGARQQEWLNLLELELANLHAALAWYQSHTEERKALELASNLWEFWYKRSYFADGRKWLSQLLAMPSNAQRDELRAQGLNVLGNLAYNQGDYSEAQERHEESLAIRKALPDQPDASGSYNNLGLIARCRGEYPKAIRLFKQAAAINRTPKGKSKWLPINLNNLANVLYDQQLNAKARERQEQSLAIFQELDNTWGIAMAMCDLGNIDYEDGQILVAHTKHESSLSKRRGIGDKRGQALSLAALGRDALAQEDLGSALSCFKQSLALRWKLQDMLGVAESLEDCAGFTAKRWPKQAHRLAGAAAKLRSKLKAPRSPTASARLERWLQPTHGLLDELELAVSLVEGQGMSIEEAIREVSNIEL